MIDKLVIAEVEMERQGRELRSILKEKKVQLQTKKKRLELHLETKLAWAEAMLIQSAD